MDQQQRYNRWIKAVLKKWFGRCPHCCKKPTGGIHHIMPRGCSLTKYVVENGIPTCCEFHRMFEDPKKEKNLIVKYIGNNLYKKLKNVANGILTLEEAGLKEIK